MALWLAKRNLPTTINPVAAPFRQNLYTKPLWEPNGKAPCTIHWTVDFLRDGKGEVMFWLESQAFDADQYSWEMTYTYDGHNAGVITDADGNWPFTLDPYNRTMSVTLQFQTQHEEGGQMFTYGGPTTLHQTR